MINFVKDLENRCDRANKIGRIIGRIEMLEARIEFRRSTFDREDIIEELISIRKELNDLEL